MKKTIPSYVLPSYVLLACMVLRGQQSPPDHAQKEPSATHHHDGVNKRGDHVMGFSHAKTTHHFLLSRNGGSIRVEANSTKDTESRDQIRKHLAHIAIMFANGNFQEPMLIHDRVPPGVPDMKRLKDEMSYRFESLSKGGVIHVESKNSEGVKAIHEFLRFQIMDHNTGDSMEIKNGKP
jgi:hypothetical protein